MKTGGIVIVDRFGRQLPARIQLASQNERSLIVVFEYEGLMGSTTQQIGLALFRHEHEDFYRDLMSHERVDITPVDLLVHILWQGRALCRVHPKKLPGEWPENERWVGLNDPEQLPKANCPLCSFVKDQLNIQVQ